MYCYNGCIIDRSLYVNGEAFECMPGSDDSNVEPTASPDTSNGGDETISTASNVPITTTTAKTFVPTVAGERGIFAPWPKKVEYIKTRDKHKLIFMIRIPNSYYMLCILGYGTVRTTG